MCSSLLFLCVFLFLLHHQLYPNYSSLYSLCSSQNLNLVNPCSMISVMKGKTLGSIVRSLVKDKTSSAAGKLVSPSVAASSPIRDISYAESLGKKETCELPSLPDLPNIATPLARIEVRRERKRLHFRKTLSHGSELVGRSAYMLGNTPDIQVFDGKRRESIKKCNALIKRCIQGARIATDERSSARHMHLAFDMFNSMKTRRFPLEEETYGPLLEYLIDRRMTKFFCIFLEVIKNENPSSHSRLGYYMMMLWIRLHDDTLVSYDGETMPISQESVESLLLALCESERTKELVQLLERVDMAKFSSLDVLARIFKYLGRLLLESIAEKVLLEFKASDRGTGNTSNMIYSYVLGIPNLTVEEVISKFKNLHRKLEVTPSCVSYEKLIIYCCDSLKVHVALELADEMIELGLTFPLETLHSILQASSEINCDANLVHQIYSVISRGNLKPNSETFRSMIDLCVKVKDYEGAYSMLSDLDNMNLMPKAAMYNAITAGYFQENNVSRLLEFLKEAKAADVKPDDQTHSLLFFNNYCESVTRR